MRKIFYVVLGSGLFLLGFSTPSQASPKTAPRTPWFTTEQNLMTKEMIIEANIQNHITPTGLLLYTALFPWSDQDKYLISHNIADLPAWQGYLMAAYAFKEAVTGQDQDPQILRLTQGLLKYYEVTGIPGLIGRSVIPDYTGPRLPWMDTEANRPTRFWMQGPQGQWWRNGVAKDHFNLAVFGTAIPLALERWGRIQLAPETKQALLDFLMPAVRRFVQNGFHIKDWNGKTTEFGNLSPQVANGFNQLLSLHILVTAAYFDYNIYQVYRDSRKKWARTIHYSLEAIGQFISRYIDEKRGEIDKPSFSDMQAIGLAYLSLAMQDFTRKYMKPIRRGIKGLWKFMRYERNPMFAIPFIATIRMRDLPRMAAIVEDLRDFPIDKYRGAALYKDTKYIQPLANRPHNSNYWKSNPFRLILVPPPPRTENEAVFAGMDYLLAYWMGRFFKLVPAE